MDYDWNCSLGKVQPSQLVLYPRSKLKIISPRKTVRTNDIRWFNRLCRTGIL